MATTIRVLPASGGRNLTSRRQSGDVPGRAEQEAYAQWMETQRSYANPMPWLGEDLRSRSYCTASRGTFFADSVPTRLEEFPASPMPWQQRPEVMADTIAYALNGVSAETTVTFYAWPHTNARVELPNGWQVSINYGPQAYTSVRPDMMGDPARVYERMFADRRGPGWADEATAVEVAIFQPDGRWFEPHEAMQRTWGYVQSADVLRVIDAVAKLPGDRSPLDGISEDCPCPNCVLTDRLVSAGSGGART